MTDKALYDAGGVEITPRTIRTHGFAAPLDAVRRVSVRRRRLHPVRVAAPLGVAAFYAVYLVDLWRAFGAHGAERAGRIIPVEAVPTLAEALINSAVFGPMIGLMLWLAWRHLALPWRLTLSMRDGPERVLHRRSRAALRPIEQALAEACAAAA